jgi:hypothetical protein
MRHVSLGDLPANNRAGNDFTAILHGGDDLDIESKLRAEFLQQLYIPGLFVAEMEILANQHGLHMQIAYENLLDEFLGRKPREFEREGQDNGGFETERIEPFQSLRIGREARGRGLRPEYFPRRWVKGKRGGDRMQSLRALDSGAKNRLMAQVDAIEVANGQHTTVPVCGIAQRPSLGRGERRQPSRWGAVKRYSR